MYVLVECVPLNTFGSTWPRKRQLGHVGDATTSSWPSSSSASGAMYMPPPYACELATPTE